MALLISSLLVILAVGGGTARTIEPESVLYGTLYAIHPTTGEATHVIKHRHLETVDSTHAQSMRLDLGPVHGYLDIQLRQDSVWAANAVVTVRGGEGAEGSRRDLVDGRCFLSGLVTSQNGAATLNRCGRLSGMIQTDGLHFFIEETGDGGAEMEIRNVKVTTSRPTKMDPSSEDIVRSSDEFRRVRRQSDMAEVEVGLYLDADFVRHMSETKKAASDRELTEMMIMKWNLINAVFANETLVGVPFRVALKNVEIWATNPLYYAGFDASTSLHERFHGFCNNVPQEPAFDVRMLYTADTGHPHYHGVSGLHGVCKPTHNCAMVRVFDDSVGVELHQLGHVIGLYHHYVTSCSATDSGFMNTVSPSNRFLPCYRPYLLDILEDPRAQCLFQKNVPDSEVLNVE